MGTNRPATTSRAICVLGMHRSGTSLITRTASLLGVYLGPEESLLTAKEDNPKGFWEQQAIADLNEEILVRLGGTWHEPPEFTKGWEADPEIAGLRERARCILDEQFAHVPLWGWKDPRACLTLPVWKSFLPNMKVVFCLRNPVDVARSLAKRDGFSFEKAVNLWFLYVTSALLHSAESPREFFFYEDFMSDGMRELKRLADFIGNPNLASHEEVQHLFGDFVDLELQHYRASTMNVADEQDLDFPAKSLYMVLRLYVDLRRRNDIDDTHAFEDALNRFAQYGSEDRAPFANLRAQLRELQEEWTRASQEATALKNAFNEQQEIVDQKNHELARLTSQQDSLSRQLEALQSALEQNDRRLADLSEELERSRQRLRTQEHDLVDKDEQILRLHDAIYSRDQALLEIEKSLAWILIAKYQQLRNKYLPAGSWRAREYHLFTKIVKVFLKEGIASVLRKTKRRIAMRRMIQPATRYPELADSVLGMESSPPESELLNTHARRWSEPNSERRLDPYDAWLSVNRWSDKAETHLRNRLENVKGLLPLISVVVPTFDPTTALFQSALSSVRAQVYENWEICIGCHVSRSKTAIDEIVRWTKLDHRVKASASLKEGFSGSLTNRAANLAQGEFLAFLQDDDQWSPDALAEIALFLSENPEMDIVYSDNDTIDDSGRRADPCFKPDWSPELLLSCMYCGSILCMRRSLFDRLGGARERFEGAEDYDLLLRAAEQSKHVGHVPLVLCHRRAATVLSGPNMSTASRLMESRRAALQETIDRRARQAVVFQPSWARGENLSVFALEFSDCGPLVSIIIRLGSAARASGACVASLQKTTYSNYEIILVESETTESRKAALPDTVSGRVLTMTDGQDPNNHAAVLNFAARQARGEYLVFLDPEVEALQPRWLSRMMGYAKMPEIGAIGASLGCPDGSEHRREQNDPLGSVLGTHEFTLVFDSGREYQDRLTHNCSAVSALCMLTPRSLFLDIGGFNDESFGAAYYDIDYCYRLLKKGYRCVSCAEAALIDRGKRSYDPSRHFGVVRAFREKYRGYVNPWRNPNLSWIDGEIKIQPKKLARFADHKIRALMCSHNLNWEGAPQSQFEMTVALKKKGLLDPVVYSPEGGPLKVAYESQNIEVVVGSHPLLGVFTKSQFDEAVTKFGDLCRDLSVELIYANTLQTFYAIAAADRIGLPSLWNQRESEPWQTYFDFVPPNIREYAFKCFAYPYRVIFVANATRTAWEALNVAHNFTVVPNGLDMDRLRRRCGHWTRETARKSLALNERQTMVLLLGTVCERKGQQDLPFALGKLPENVAQQVRCYIVGDRETAYSTELKRIIAKLSPAVAENIRVIPETHDVGLYFRAADILLCTSRVESYPRVILEGMAVGLPIITTDVFGIKEQVLDQVNGLFYPPADIDALAAALVRVVSDGKLRESLAANSLKVLDSLVTFEEMVSDYAKLFNEAAASKG